MAPTTEEGLILRFECVTASPFHTARQEYANLIKCAPFILGSTLRGAALNDLIRAHCPEETLRQLDGLTDPAAIADVHRNCAADCPAKHFYAEPAEVRFSFGIFDGEPALARTRIALDRETSSVAEGAIVSVEAVPAGTGFSFEIALLGEAIRFRDEIEAALRRAGQMWGIGRLRSVGFGQYEVRRVESASITDRLSRFREQFAKAGSEITLEFVTPYVLGDGSSEVQVSGEALAERVGAELGVKLERVEARLELDFVSRFSFERGLRENYLVAWRDSQMTLKSAENGSAWVDALARSATFGLGRLDDWGFGQFRIRERNDTGPAAA